MNLIGLTAIAGVSYAVLMDPDVREDIIDRGKSAIDSYNNAAILDTNGNVIRKYHATVKFGEEVAGALMRRG